MIQPLPVVSVRDLGADVRGRPRKNENTTENINSVSLTTELLWPQFSIRQDWAKEKSRGTCRLFRRFSLDSQKSHEVWRQSHIFPGFAGLWPGHPVDNIGLFRLLSRTDTSSNKFVALTRRGERESLHVAAIPPG
jgi:hypothetical protein